MKAKLTLTIEEELIPRAKEYARARGLSLSRLIEHQLREQVPDSEKGRFSQRWRGKFAPAERDDERYRALAKKHL